MFFCKCHLLPPFLERRSTSVTWTHKPCLSILKRRKSRSNWIESPNSHVINGLIVKSVRDLWTAMWHGPCPMNLIYNTPISPWIPDVNDKWRDGKKINYIHHVEHILLKEVINGQKFWLRLRSSSTFGCFDADTRKAISTMKKQLKTISVIKKTNWNPDNDLTISTGITERPIGMFWEAPTGDSLWIGPFMKLGSFEASRRTMNRLEIFPWIQWCASRGHSRSSYGLQNHKLRYVKPQV